MEEASSPPKAIHKLHPHRALGQFVKRELGLKQLPAGVGKINGMEAYFPALCAWLDSQGREDCLGIPKHLSVKQLLASDWWKQNIEPLIEEDHAKKVSASQAANSHVNRSQSDTQKGLRFLEKALDRFEADPDTFPESDRKRLLEVLPRLCAKVARIAPSPQESVSERDSCTPTTTSSSSQADHDEIDEYLANVGDAENTETNANGTNPIAALGDDEVLANVGDLETTETNANGTNLVAVLGDWVDSFDNEDAGPHSSEVQGFHTPGEPPHMFRSLNQAPPPMYRSLNEAPPPMYRSLSEATEPQTVPTLYAPAAVLAAPSTEERMRSIIKRLQQLLH